MTQDKIQVVIEHTNRGMADPKSINERTDIASASASASASAAFFLDK